MKRDQWLEFFDQQPGSVQAYLLGNEAGERETRAQTTLAYDNDVWDRIMDVVWDLLFLKTSRAEFTNRIRALAGDRKPDEVERTILELVVLPLADLVAWDVEARLTDLGAPQSEIQAVTRISLRPVSYGSAARRIASLAKISLLGEETVARLRDVLVSYIKGVRSEEQVLDILQRPQVEGGLGFAKQQALAFIERMKDFLAATQVMSETAFADWLQNSQRETESEQAVIASSAAKTGDKKTEGMIGEQKERRLDPVLEATIDECIKNINLQKPLEEFLMTRLRNLISSRLRDVRNREQILMMLQREEKVGGMGFDPAEAERITVVIENTYKEKREIVEQEAKSKIIKIQDEQKKKIEERRKRESEEHAAWYREKVMAVRGDQALRQMIVEGNKQTPQAGAAPQQPATMDGIMAAGMKLSSLADELRNMDIEAYRRLSRDPQQAAEKVFQKLETLKRESFERWTEGVEAWRQSTLQQQYLRLVTESFSSGRPVSELVEEKRKTDPRLPTAEELGSIIALNAKIQL
ncbi:hypothetical protein M0Q28_01315 [Patescibacteria group bacterium]|jgi:hypothetical protein|nr:hypothetical protein [Patescibacteria group bacterium]